MEDIYQLIYHLVTNKGIHFDRLLCDDIAQLELIKCCSTQIDSAMVEYITLENSCYNIFLILWKSLPTQKATCHLGTTPFP